MPTPVDRLQLRAATPFRWNAREADEQLRRDSPRHEDAGQATPVRAQFNEQPMAGNRGGRSDATAKACCAAGRAEKPTRGKPQYPITELLTHRFPLATIAPGRHSVWDPSTCSAFSEEDRLNARGEGAQIPPPKQ